MISGPEAGQVEPTGTPLHAAGEVHRLDARGVYLLSGDAEALSAVPELRLSLDDGGVRVVRPDGSPVLEQPWDEIVEVSVPGHATTPDGGSAVEVVVRPVSGSAHRLVVPTHEPDQLEERLAALASRQGVAPGSPDRAPPLLLVGAVLLATTAVVAVLLLAAGHLIRL